MPPTPATCRGALPDCTPWGVLVSEVMLQQTPVARVEPVWREWLARWPTPADLAAEPPGEAVRAWGRLGYPRRALRLHEAAGAIVERHGGRCRATRSAARCRGSAPTPRRRWRPSPSAGARGRRHQRAPGPRPGGRGRGAGRPGGDGAETAPGRVAPPRGRGRRGHLERRRDGARRAGVHGPRPRAARVPGRRPVRLGRPAGPAYDGPPTRARPGRHRPPGPRRRPPGAARGARAPPAQPRSTPAARCRAGRPLLASLVEDGLVEPPGAGRYRLPGDGGAPAR